MIERLLYLAESALHSFSTGRRACPSCGTPGSARVSRKYLVTQLRRCSGCQLLFRAPVTPASQLAGYYDARYESGFTTDLPDRAQLQRYLQKGFRDTAKDFTRYVGILHALGVPAGGRVLDFGASWGYGTWQLMRARFDAIGYELSPRRARYARDELQVSVVDDRSALTGPLDAVIAVHVLEHIPGLRDVLDFLTGLLGPRGVLISVTPNGSFEYRARNPGAWQRSWGLKHPLLLDEQFWRAALPGCPMLITSDAGNVRLLESWRSQPRALTAALDGSELLVACMRA